MSQRQKVTTSERIAKLEEQLAAKKARLSRLKAIETAEARRLDARQKIIVGAAVLAHAELFPLFAEQLAEILDKAVTRERDKRDINAILDLLTTPSEKR